jgi:hypothetical protein
MSDEELKRIHHDAANAIAVVRATLEGMIDGVVPLEPERLERLVASLERAGTLLDRLLSHVTPSP